jgi:hypothetical protein
MKKALISPNESPIEYVSGWTQDNPPQPIYLYIENSCRIAQVSNKTFEVAPPLFWTDCEDDVIANQWYYNINDSEIYQIPLPPPILIDDSLKK